MQYLVTVRAWDNYRGVEPDFEAEMILGMEPPQPDTNALRAEAILMADQYMRSDLQYANAVNQTLAIRPAVAGDLA
jgi:hypothetical protein